MLWSNDFRGTIQLAQGQYSPIRGRHIGGKTYRNKGMIYKSKFRGQKPNFTSAASKTIDPSTYGKALHIQRN